MDNTTTIQQIKEKLEKFNNDREWYKYHQPKDLILAIQDELGELANCYLWVNDAEIQQMYKDPKKLNAITLETIRLILSMK